MGPPRLNAAVALHRTGRILSSPELPTLLKAGATIPPFALPDQQGETVRSEELLAQGPLVLFFYIVTSRRMNRSGAGHT